MLFSQLVLERVIFEIRYDQGFIFFDNSGKVSTDIVAKFPQFQLRDVKLSNVQSDWSDEGITINFSHLKGDVVQDYPSSLKTFQNVCNCLAEAIQRHMNVSTLTRVGVRFMFAYHSDTEQEATDLMGRIPLISVDHAKIQPFGRDIVERQLLFRIIDEDRGFTIRIMNITRDYSIIIPKPFKVNREAFRPNAVVFDVDCYTKKLVDASIFDAAEYIRISERSVAENLLDFVGL